MSLGSEPEKTPQYPTGYVPRRIQDDTIDNHEFFKGRESAIVFGGRQLPQPQTLENQQKIRDKTLESPGVPMIEKSTCTFPQEMYPIETKKHNHYFKNVSKLEFVDVYRVLSLYNVTDACLQHAVKKLLVAGGRGAGKDINRDIQEAIDTLVRWQEIQKENDK